MKSVQRELGGETTLPLHELICAAWFALCNGGGFPVLIRRDGFDDKAGSEVRRSVRDFARMHSCLLDWRRTCGLVPKRA
jgi:hypothetical protein